METALKIAKYLDVEPIVKYTAIQLYDKFIRYRFWEICKTQLTNGMSDAFCQEINEMDAQKSAQYLIICFFMSANMDSRSYNVRMPVVSIFK